MPVETMADDIDDVDALLEEPYQKVSHFFLFFAKTWTKPTFQVLFLYNVIMILNRVQWSPTLLVYFFLYHFVLHLQIELPLFFDVKLTGVPFVSQVSPFVCLSSATSAQVALPKLLIGAVLKTLKSSSKPLCASQ